jgi:uncharacterized protein YecT (DUF1311 family)
VILLLAMALGVTQPMTDAGSKNLTNLAQAEIDMDTQFNAAIDRLRNCKPMNSTKCYYWLEAIPRLQKEQSAWVAWRNAKSDLNAVVMEGSSGEADVRAYFNVRMTKARSAELSKVGRE